MARTVALSNGVEIPRVGFGTFKAKGDECKAAVSTHVVTAACARTCEHMYLVRTKGEGDAFWMVRQTKLQACTFLFSQVLAALRAGTRHIDTASIYKNEEAVGQAVRESGLERSEIFVTSKVSPYEQVLTFATRCSTPCFARHCTAHPTRYCAPTVCHAHGLAHGLWFNVDVFSM